MLATIAGISMYLMWALGISLYHKMKNRSKTDE